VEASAGEALKPKRTIDRTSPETTRFFHLLLDDLVKKMELMLFARELERMSTGFSPLSTYS
jgi:hypothetical protein